MAISMDWTNKIINIPRADLQLVQSTPTEIRQLDLNAFRLELGEIEASEEGIAFLTIHNHNPPVTVGGVTLARVVEIINGYTVTFEDGQYAVNLVGANSNVADVTNVNQVSIRSANSAGLTFSEQINAQSFTDDAVSIDTVDGLSGIVFPRGTPTDPVNNFADAAIIADSRNLKAFKLRGSIALSSNPHSMDGSYTGYNFLSTGVHSTEVINLNNIECNNSSFHNLNITGTQNGIQNIFNGCVIDNVSGITGILFQCGLYGTILLNNTGVTTMHDVYTVNTSTLDFNSGTNVSIYATAVSGDLTIINMTDASDILEIHYVSGKITIDSSCTNGTIIIRGLVDVVDNSTGTSVSVTSVLSQDAITDIANTVWTQTIEGTLTAEQVSRVLLAVASGKTTIIDNGNGTASVAFRDVADLKDRILATMTGSERTSVTIDGN